MKIILATGSKHRVRAFQMLGIDCIAEESGVDEKFEGRPSSPRDLVMQLARFKMEAVAQKYDSGIVIGFDSVGYFQDEILEKPVSMQAAQNRLKSMSGKSFSFYTGIVVRNISAKKELAESVQTDALMRIIRDEEIDTYLDQDTDFNTYALGFDPLGHYSATFIKEIKGSYNNLLRGIPLEKIVEMINTIQL